MWPLVCVRLHIARRAAANAAANAAAANDAVFVVVLCRCLSGSPFRVVHPSETSFRVSHPSRPSESAIPVSHLRQSSESVVRVSRPKSSGSVVARFPPPSISPRPPPLSLSLSLFLPHTHSRAPTCTRPMPLEAGPRSVGVRISESRTRVSYPSRVSESGPAQVLAERLGGDPSSLSPDDRARLVAAYERAIDADPRCPPPPVRVHSPGWPPGSAENGIDLCSRRPSQPRRREWTAVRGATACMNSSSGQLRPGPARELRRRMRSRLVVVT